MSKAISIVSIKFKAWIEPSEESNKLSLQSSIFLLLIYQVDTTSNMDVFVSIPFLIHVGPINCATRFIKQREKKLLVKIKS